VLIRRAAQLILVALAACSRPLAALVYRDPDAPLDARVADLLGRLSLAEKASLLSDKDPGIERLGLPKYDAWNEALHGVAWRDGVTVFPQAIGLASTWDPDRLQRVASAISTEARALYNQGSDAQSRRETIDAGRYELLLGASSADIRQKAVFDVVPD
jgi:beta-glucosidase